MPPSNEALSLLSFFSFSHLPERLATISAGCAGLADRMVEELADTDYDSELTTGLRKLLEAKDCFVRASLKKR